MNRQKLLLLILAGIFVISLIYAFWAAPRPQRVADGERPPAVSSRAAKTAEPVAPIGNRVHLELLARDEEEFPGFERDIFRFRQPAPKPVPPQPIARVAPPPPPPPPIQAAPSVMEEVQRELARFTFLGFLQKEGIKTIFLSSGGEIFVVKKGDRFGKEKQFLVTELSPEVLTIRQHDDPRPIIVPLVEQAPLTPSNFRGGAPSGQQPPRGLFQRPSPGQFPPPSGRFNIPEPVEVTPEEPMEEEEPEAPPEESPNGQSPAAGEAPTPEAESNEVQK